MRTGIVLAPLLLFSACASQPMGPTVAVAPAAGKAVPVFEQEQTQCKQFADEQTAAGADRINLRQIGSVAVGAVLGRGLGSSARSDGSLQRHYDVAYTDCMATYGNKLPDAPRVALLPAR
jgi:hypothetical protein